MFGFVPVDPTYESEYPDPIVKSEYPDPIVELANLDYNTLIC